MKYLTWCLEGQQCDSSQFHDLPEEPLVSAMLKEAALLPGRSSTSRRHKGLSGEKRSQEDKTSIGTQREKGQPELEK